jgi:hypothetical protein
MSAKKKPTIEQFLAKFPIQIQELASTLDLLIKSSVPEARGAVYVGWQLIGYRAKRLSRDVYFAYVYPTPDYVDIGFEYGILLEDQDRLLNGDGKQVRYARFDNPKDIPTEKLAQLIVEAVDIAFLNKEQKQQLFLKYDSDLDAKKLGPSDR